MMSALKLKFMNSSNFTRFYNGQSNNNSVVGEKYRKFSSETDSSASEDGNNNKKIKKYIEHQVKNIYNKNKSDDAKLTMARTNNRADKVNAAKSSERPLFITTVKSGKFLDPPPELAYLFGLTQNCNASSSSTNDSSISSNGSNKKKNQKQIFLYSFSSQPRVLNQTHHKSRCETAAQAAVVTENTSQLSNNKNSREARNNDTSSSGHKSTPKYMARGSNFIPYPIPTNSESQTTRQQQARRRALARRRAQGGYIRLGTPPPVVGRHHKTIQTDIVFEEIYINTLKSEAECQTELHQDSQPSETYTQKHPTEEAETQLNEGELFDSDAELEIILPSFIEQIVEDSLVEVLEEEEEEALQIQQAFVKNKAAAED